MRDNWKEIVTTATSIAVGVVVTAFTANPVLGGMAAGFAGGFTGSLLNGESIGNAFLAGHKGAVIGGFSGAVTSGVSAWIGDFSGVVGSGPKNAMFEIGHSVLKGGAQGLSGGGIMAALNQDVSYLWKGAAFGAAVGGGMAGLRIAVMGPTFVPDPNYKLEDFGQVHRRGSILPLKGTDGMVLGRNVVTKLTGDTDFDRWLLHHETGHLSQINEMGAFKFYSRWVSEVAKHGLSNVYDIPGTIEFGANHYSFDKLGYYYDTSRRRFPLFPLKFP